MANAVVLLGPQRHHPIIGSVLEDRRLRGPFALITAGWQEREREDEELREAIGGAPAINLAIYRRFEILVDEDPELEAALHKRQEQLRELQDVYRLRLRHLMAAARALFDHAGAAELLEPERASALETVRQLDRHHLARVENVLRDFDHQMRPAERKAVLRQRSELAQAVQDAGAVLVAGGHVATLLNRMWIFGLDEQLRHRPIVAWSAGAMAVTERVVLFHDNPPQGAGHAELLTRGMGLCRGVLALPNGSSRLQIDDPVRVALLARRFAELRPVLLDPHRRVDWDPPRWIPGDETRMLRTDGAIELWKEEP